MTTNQHHYDQGYRAALRGRRKDARKRSPAHAKAYREGHEDGWRMFERAANHGMLQKLGDAL